MQLTVQSLAPAEMVIGGWLGPLVGPFQPCDSKILLYDSMSKHLNILNTNREIKSRLRRRSGQIEGSTSEMAGLQGNNNQKQKCPKKISQWFHQMGTGLQCPHAELFDFGI